MSKKNKSRTSIVPTKTCKAKKGYKTRQGRQHEVQAAIVEQFAPRFANGGTLLHFGETTKKVLFDHAVGLENLGIPIDEHSQWPDVLAHASKGNWLFLIEAVTSLGSDSLKLFAELEYFLNNFEYGQGNGTTFPYLKVSEKQSNNLARENKVWLTENSGNMIQFNGNWFMVSR